MNRNGELKTIGIIEDTFGIRGLREMGYNITKTNLKPRFVLCLSQFQLGTSPPGNPGENFFE